MTVRDLEPILKRHNVPKSHYSLTASEEPLAESYLCIRTSPANAIHIVERNQITMRRTFATEDEACRAFLKELRIV